MGTPAYMAPEQFRAERADARTDQFSFCVSLYEALYGERPFAGDSLPALVDAVPGRLREPPQQGRVPASSQGVLRGLRRSRRAYPSMRACSALCARCGAAAGLRRRRRARPAAVAPSANGCDARAALLSAPTRVATAWECRRTGARRRAMRGRSRRPAERAGRPGSERPAARRLRAAAGARYAEACEATHVRGDQRRRS